MVVGSESMMAWSWVFYRFTQKWHWETSNFSAKGQENSTEASPKKHPAIRGTNQPSKLTFIATGLHASLTLGPKDLHPEEMNGWNPPKLEGLEGDFPFQLGDFRWFQPLILTDFEDFWGITTGLHFFRPWLVGLRYSFRVYAENRVGWKLRRPFFWGTGKPVSEKTRDPSYGQKSCCKKVGRGVFIFDLCLECQRVGRWLFFIEKSVVLVC